MSHSIPSQSLPPPNQLAGLVQQGRETEATRIAAIAAAREAALGRGAKNFQSVVANITDFRDAVGPGATVSAIGGGARQTGIDIEPGRLAALLQTQTGIHAQRAADLGVAGKLAGNLRDLGAAQKDLTEGGTQLPGDEILRAIAGDDPQNIREVATGNQTRLASSLALADAQKTGPTVYVGRDNTTGAVLGFGKTRSDLFLELTKNGHLGPSFTITLETPDKLAIGGEVGLSTFAPGKGGGGKPDPDTPAEGDAQPEGTETTKLAPVSGDPVPLESVEQFEKVVREGGVVDVPLDNGETITFRSAGDGEHVFASGAGRGDVEPIPISEVVDSFNKAIADAKAGSQ